MLSPLLNLKKLLNNPKNIPITNPAFTPVAAVVICAHLVKMYATNNPKVKQPKRIIIIVYALSSGCGNLSLKIIP